MIHVLLQTEYPPETGLGGDPLTFTLCDGYGCRDAAEAHAWVLELLRLGEVATILDNRGEPWELWSEVVRVVATWGG